MDTKSTLLDIVKHTATLGLIENIKVVGTDDSTKLNAIDPDKIVIFKAEMHDVVPEFKGEFGMGNLNLLSSLTRLSAYTDDDASIVVHRQERNGAEVPATLTFKNGTGSKDEYRFMAKEIIDHAMGNAEMAPVNWDITVVPTKEKVSELSEVAGIYMNIEPNFTIKTEDGNLVFEVGSPEGGITGRRVFANNVDGTLAVNWSWKLNPVLSVMKLGMSAEMCTLRISERGVLEVNIDSGIAKYLYIFPAMSQ